MKRNHLVLAGLAAGTVLFLYFKIYRAPGTDSGLSPRAGADSPPSRLQVLQKKLDLAMQATLQSAKPGTSQEDVIAEFERQHAPELAELRTLEAAAESGRADPKLRAQIQEQTTAAVAANRAVRARLRSGELTGLTPELLPPGLKPASELPPEASPAPEVPPEIQSPPRRLDQ